MATDSIKELIMQDVVAAIKEIQVTNGYANTLETRAVVRGRDAVDSGVMPIAYVFEGADRKNSDPADEFGAEVLSHRILSVVVALYASSQEKLTEKLNSLEADIVKAVMVDQKRDNNATTTIWDDSTVVFDPGNPLLGGRELVFSVYYTVIETDPYRQ